MAQLHLVIPPCQRLRFRAGFSPALPRAEGLCEHAGPTRAPHRQPVVQTTRAGALKDVSWQRVLGWRSKVSLMLFP